MSSAGFSTGKEHEMRAFADEACLEPEEEPPDDNLALTRAWEEWLRGQGLSAPDETGASGCGLVNAARDAIIDDDLSRLSDAELIEQATRSRVLAARAIGRQFRTLTEFLRRRPPRRKGRRFEEQDARRDEKEGIPADAPHRPQVPVLPSEEAAGEIALAFTLTDYSAGALTAMIADLACRLPQALEGLENGVLDEVRVKILWEYSRDLSDENARKFDASLSVRAGDMTTGELRDRARREQIRIDPEAAERRRKRGERSSRVVLYPNDDHTANLGVENAPAELAAAAKGRVGAIARAAKAAGAAENIGLLESKTFLGLLLGTLEEIPPSLPPDDGPGYEGGEDPGDSPGPDGGHGPDNGPGSEGRRGDDDGPGGSPSDGPPDLRSPEPPNPEPRDPEPRTETVPWPVIPGGAGAASPGCAVIPPGLRSGSAGRLRFLSPWRTLAGIAADPGDLSWFGAITPCQAIGLARAAAADPSVTWRVIVTDDDGHALAVTTLGRRNRARASGPGLIDEVTVTIQASLAAALDSDEDMRGTARSLAADPDPRLTQKLLAVITAANKAAAEAETQAMLDAEAGGCAHAAEVPGYRVPATMRRRLCARDFTCRNPVCRRRGTQCDIDHSLAYDKGGRTCTCNTGPLCRAHHRLKQCHGWKLEQEPGTGIFTWTTPAGLAYRATPHQYPV